MLRLRKKPSKLLFASRVKTTFGKLDEQDIGEINGCSERLVMKLMDRYGWNPTYAHTKVAQFSSNLSDRSHVPTLGHTND